MSTVYFNPLDTACKNKIGAVKTGEELQFNVFLLKYEYKCGWGNRIPTDALRTPREEDCQYPEHDAFFVFCKDGELPEYYPLQKTAFGWSITFLAPDVGLYFYHFSVKDMGFISCGEQETGYLSDRPQSFLLTTFSEDYTTPDWFKGGVMYQIFPDRFHKTGTMPDINGRVARKWGEEPYFRPNEYGKVLNNDFFGGNLRGIESKLPYLENLGVSVIYLNPIFEAASNHRYDTSDYMHIDPMLGTEKDLQSLINAAKNKGIRIILDGVFNHTGDDSVYFNKYGHYPSVGAYQSKESPYYTWYSFQHYPYDYASWWGIDVLPEVNENSAEYQEFIFGKEGVLKKWLGLGIGGYRLDVADELPDFFLKKLRKSVKERDENAIIIGEVWEDASNKVAYSKRREYLQGSELDSVMNYPLKDAIIGYIQSGNAGNLLHTVRVLINHYPKQTLDCLMNILGTHDTARILTVLGGVYCQNKEEMSLPSAYLSENAKKNAVRKLKMAAVLQYTLPGVPCVYYGDENGMEGHIDPFCRRCFDWERLHEDLQEFYQRLGKIRKEYRDIFKDGDFSELRVEDGLLLYKRQNTFGKIFIFVNNSSKRYLLELPEDVTELLTNKRYNKELEIQPYGYGIFVNKK